MTTPFNRPADLRVLVTGAAGNIGRALRAHLKGRYALLRLTDVGPQEPPGPGEEVATVDIRDVAARAGVAVKAVTRVLDRPPYVRGGTRGRVEKGVRERDFRPSGAARILSGAKSNQVALIYDNHSPYYMFQIQTGCWDFCREKGIRVLAQPVDVADPQVRERVRDPRTAVLALTHDPRIDDLALIEALNTPAFYVGALGSRVNAARRRARLSQMGLSAAALARLHAPIGLPLGSRTPAEIAVSILAALTARRHGVVLHVAGQIESGPAVTPVSERESCGESRVSC